MSNHKWSTNTFLTANTVSVIVAIFLASGIEQLLTKYTTVDPAAPLLLFMTNVALLSLGVNILCPELLKDKESKV